MFCPAANFSAPAGFLPLTKRSQSSMRFCAPRMRFQLPRRKVCCRSSGLVHKKLDGEQISSSCRDANSTTLSCCLVTPRTPVVALCHHCWLRRKL